MTEHRLWVVRNKRTGAIGRAEWTKPDPGFVDRAFEVVEGVLTLPDPPPDPEWTVAFSASGGVEILPGTWRDDDMHFHVRAADAQGALAAALKAKEGSL